jgi:transcription initiation factor TFIID subunit 5
MGYYFASCGHDKTARLWTTEQASPLRLFQGHFSDIDCLSFHPNSNYIGTGSSDRAVRLWDCVTGSCVRFMTGHKSAVLVLVFSPDGRFIASGGSDKKVLIWDISVGHLVSQLEYHTGGISGLGFSREGTILASSGLDSTLALWDFGTLLTESANDEMNVAQNPEVRKDTDALLLASYRTKSSPILHLHFTRRNLLLAIGCFEPSYL